MNVRPVIPPDLQPIAYAFDFLNLSRPVGFSGPGAIPLVEIRAYLETYPVGMHDGEFIELIRLIDAEHLTASRKKQKADDGASSNTRGSD